MAVAVTLTVAFAVGVADVILIADVYVAVAANVVVIIIVQTISNDKLVKKTLVFHLTDCILDFCNELAILLVIMVRIDYE